MTKKQEATKPTLHRHTMKEEKNKQLKNERKKMLQTQHKEPKR